MSKIAKRHTQVAPTHATEGLFVRHSQHVRLDQVWIFHNKTTKHTKLDKLARRINK